MTVSASTELPMEFFCSFCGVSSHAHRLVAGPGCFICRECALLAVELSGPGEPIREDEDDV